MNILHQRPHERFLELDLWRGLAVASMIVFHVFFFLNYFEFLEIAYWKGGWKVFARLIQWSFFLLVGIGLHLSYQHHRDSGKPFFSYMKRLILRSLIVFVAAMLVTVFTGIFFPEETIYFGVLHFIAVSILVTGFLVAPRPWLGPVLAMMIYAASFWVNDLETTSFFLMPLGLKLIGFRTFDYFSLFPWLAIPMMGVYFGQFLYPKAVSRFRFSVPNIPGVNPALLFFGQHALMIYLVHPPIIVAVLAALKFWLL